MTAKAASASYARGGLFSVRASDTCFRKLILDFREFLAVFLSKLINDPICVVSAFYLDLVEGVFEVATERGPLVKTEARALFLSVIYRLVLRLVALRGPNLQLRGILDLVNLLFEGFDLSLLVLILLD